MLSGPRNKVHFRFFLAIPFIAALFFDPEETGLTLECRFAVHLRKFRAPHLHLSKEGDDPAGIVAFEPDLDIRNLHRIHRRAKRAFERRLAASVLDHMRKKYRDRLEVFRDGPSCSTPMRARGPPWKAGDDNGKVSEIPGRIGGGNRSGWNSPEGLRQISEGLEFERRQLSYPSLLIVVQNQMGWASVGSEATLGAWKCRQRHTKAMSQFCHVLLQRLVLQHHIKNRRAVDALDQRPPADAGRNPYPTAKRQAPSARAMAADAASATTLALKQ